jgi:hypothetical protein
MNLIILFFLVECALFQKKCVSCTPKYEGSSFSVFRPNMYLACSVAGLSEAVGIPMLKSGIDVPNSNGLNANSAVK